MHKPIAVVSFGCRSSTLPTEFSPNYVIGIVLQYAFVLDRL